MQPLDFFSDRTMLALKIALNGTAKRHEALAHNIANANTPGFKRHDVTFQEQLRAALASHPEKLPLVRTHPKHFASHPQTLRQEEVKVRAYVETDTQMRNDRNNVDIDREMSLLTANAIQYQILTRLIAARYNLMRIVVQS